MLHGFSKLVKRQFIFNIIKKLFNGGARLIAPAFIYHFYYCTFNIKFILKYLKHFEVAIVTIIIIIT